MSVMLSRVKRFTEGRMAKYILADFLAVFIGFLIATYILVALGAEQLGIYTMYSALVALFSATAQGAANSYLMKRFFQQDANATIGSVNITMALFSLLSVALYVVLFPYFGKYFYVWFFLPYALLKAFNSTPYVVMRLHEEANAFLFWSLLSKSAYIPFALSDIVLGHFSLTRFLTLLFFNEILFFILTYGYLVVRYRYRIRIDRKYVKENLRVSVALSPHKIFRSVYDNVDKYAVGFFIGTEALGIYSMIMRLVSPVMIYMRATNNEIAVLLSKLFSGKLEKRELLSRIREVFALAVAVNAATILLGVGYDRFVVPLGDAFVSLFAIGLIYANGMFFYYLFYNILFLRGDKIVYFIMGINTVVFLVWVLVFGGTIVEIAVGFVATATIGNIWMFLYLKREDAILPLNAYWYGFLVLAAIVAGGVYIG